MRSASIAGLPISFPRVRTPAAVLLAGDLKALIILLLRSAKRLNDHGDNNTQHLTTKNGI
ncbi:MAG TPA: hypothetical protein VMP68_10445 [Candidatus Eisenbacteria bacterium]|nr:hypothetical protein [Candidatus Eisenbacteria bacterium]